jgi:hypothetical protein
MQQTHDIQLTARRPLMVSGAGPENAIASVEWGAEGTSWASQVGRTGPPAHKLRDHCRNKALEGRLLVSAQ